MEIIQKPLSWFSLTSGALVKLVENFILFVPKLIGALLVFLLGWLVSVLIGKLTSTVLSSAKLDELFAKTGWTEALGKARITVKPSEFIGSIVKWVLVIVFLSVATNILELAAFSDFLGRVVDYLPNVILASLIFVATVIISDIVEKIITASVQKIKAGYAVIAGAIAKGGIWFFAISAIFIQLGIFPENLITTLFSGVVYFFVISFGLAFGLGGKDIAAQILQRIKHEIEEK